MPLLRTKILAAAGFAGLFLPYGLPQAEAASLINVCTGLRTTLPVLQPIASGVLDPLLAPLSQLVNTNLVGTLSGQQIGVSALDSNGNLVNTATDCGLTSSGLQVDNNAGIALGGGNITGLGGINNTPAVSGDINGIALGNAASTTVGAANAIAIGLRGSVSATDGVALGRDTSVTAAGGIALGSSSVADRAGLSGGTEAFSGTTVASTAGALSVGAAGAERQITNVAGGTQDTDAVNLRQLKSVGSNLATAVGGGASFNSTTGNFVGPKFTLRGTVYTNVGDALTALDQATGAVAADNTLGAAYASATGRQATALGYGASASNTNSTAIGAGATTTRANQVVVGTASNTYTMPGISSSASNAAQSGPVKVVTTDANGNLGTADISGLSTSTDITALRKKVSNNQREARRGIAAAMAMTVAPTPSAPGKTAWATNVATFAGEVSTSFGVAHMLDTSYPVVLNASVGYSPGAPVGVRVGMSGEF